MNDGSSEKWGGGERESRLARDYLMGIEDRSGNTKLKLNVLTARC